MTISATTRGLRPGVCTSTSRPGSPFDGQLIYETDTNRVAVYDTNTWVYKTPASTTGSVLQVVSTTKTDTFSASVASAGITDVTGLSATITPSSASSLILVIASVGKGTYGGLVIKRGSTEIAIGTSVGSRNAISANSLGTNGDHPTNVMMHILDNPATTNATTYQISLHQTVTSTVTLYCNRSDADPDTTAASRTASTITVMEIAG